MNPSSSEDYRSEASFGTNTFDLPRLPLASSQHELQVTLTPARQEIMARAGLQSLGVSANVGRGRLEHIFRIAPGRPSYQHACPVACIASKQTEIGRYQHC